MSINVTLLFPIVHLNVFEIPLKKNPHIFLYCEKGTTDLNTQKNKLVIMHCVLYILGNKYSVNARWFYLLMHTIALKTYLHSPV